MFSAIYRFFGIILGFFADKLGGGSYLVGLLLFAVMVKIIMIPFGIKQQKTSVRQAKLRPKEEAIKKKYRGRNDKITQQKMQQELIDMQQAEGYNPMGGCLPLIIQMVVIILLWQAVMNPLQYVVGMNADSVSAFQTYVQTEAKPEDGEVKEGAVYGMGEKLERYPYIQAMRIMREKGKDFFIGSDSTEFVYFIENYKKDDKLVFNSSKTAIIDDISGAYEYLDGGHLSFDLFSDNDNFLAETPSLSFASWTAVLLLLIPLLNFGATFATAKLTKKFTYQPMQADQPGQGCSTKMMDWFLPLFSLVFAFLAPAAIGIYWLFNSVLGVAQQFILHKAFPMPTFTEEDFKAAEKELAGKAPKETASSSSYYNPSDSHSLYLEDFDEGEAPDIPVIDEDDDEPESDQTKKETKE